MPVDLFHFIEGAIFFVLLLDPQVGFDTAILSCKSSSRMYWPAQYQTQGPNAYSERLLADLGTHSCICLHWQQRYTGENGHDCCNGDIIC